MTTCIRQVWLLIIVSWLASCAVGAPSRERGRLLIVTEDYNSVSLTINPPFESSRWFLDGAEDASSKDSSSYTVSKQDLTVGTHTVAVEVKLDVFGDGDLEAVGDDYHFDVVRSEKPSVAVFDGIVTTGDDDAEERPSGRVNRSSKNLDLTYDLNRQTGDQQQIVGIRFSSIHIPSNVTVQKAYLELTVSEETSGASDLQIGIEQAAHAPAITASEGDLSGRPVGDAVAWSPDAWSAPGTVVRTPDVSALVQKVVSLEDWMFGNAIMFLVRGSGSRTAASYDGNPTAAPRLHVEFSDAEFETVSNDNLALPARGAFYYPWFPETWTVNGSHVSYNPSLGYYDSSEQAVVDAHVKDLEYANIDVAIFSWWGPDTHKESVRVPLLLERTRAAGSDLRWAAYYEQEGFANPPTSRLRADLQALQERYTGHPNYARVDGKPVLFVYNADDSDCTIADRWSEFFANWYVVLKVFPGFESCASQPAGWHQYAPSQAFDHQDDHSFTISPGFWRADEPDARLARDPERWIQNVQDMIRSGEPWQLVTTFNEWGEGTAVEQARQWESVDSGAYLDALHLYGADASTNPPEMPKPSPDTVVFGAAGDFGGKDDRAGTVMTDMLARDLTAFFLLGDVSYSEIEPESAWCDWVNGYLGESYPLQLVAGNHEEDSRVDGHILDFAACMPDRLGSAMGPGGYSVNYASDLGPLTFIGTSPDLVVNGVDYTFEETSPERTWLIESIREAKSEQDWVVVGMHKNCITIGNKSCEISESFAQLLVDEGVDVVLQGHDHDYQRSHALSRVVEDGVGNIADSGTDGAYVRGSGTVFVIVGTAGRSMTNCSHSDSEYDNFAEHWCGEEAGDTKGYLLMSASSRLLAAEFVTTTGTSFRDAFSIE